MPAKATDTKKNTANRLPMGISRKMPGRVMNSRDGPEVGSTPKANTAGIMASADSMAAMVSNRAVRREAAGISADLSR